MKITTLLLAALFIPIATSAAKELNRKDQKTLVRLYEDEILAHDLHVELGKIHQDTMPLKNIPHAETRHREIMAGVLKDYGIAIPTPPKGRRFVSKGLDKTFDAWLAEGRKSPLDACRVGVRLEDHDIAELREAQKKFPGAKQTLANLEAASGNHLRAFHRNTTSRGDSYKAEALSEKDIKKILASPHSHGGNSGKSGGCRNAGNAQAPGNARRGRGQGQQRRHRGGR